MSFLHNTLNKSNLKDPSSQHTVGFQSIHIDIALAGLCIVALGILCPLYIYHWPLWYNSDIAQMGLIGKHVLDTGECPIFIWGLGYQGMLLEGPLIALSFKLFGVNPMALNTIPVLFLLLLFYLFFRTVETSVGRRKALVATLFAIVSTPLFYAHFARTATNYPETACFGLALMLIYMRLVQSLYVSRSPVCLRHYIYFTLFGFIAGFAFYIYGQIIFYVGTIALHGSLIYLRSLHCKTLGELVKKVLFSGPSAPWYMPILTFFAIILLEGTVIWLLVGQISPIYILVLTFGFLMLAHIANWLASSPRNLSDYAWLLAAAANGFFIGFFPKIYYNYALGGFSHARLTFGGSLGDVLRRFGLAMDGLVRFTNLNRDNVITIILVSSIMVLVLLYFTVQMTRHIWKVVNGEFARADLLNISPLAVLPFCVIPAFSCSPSVEDVGSERYELHLVLWIALMVGSVAVDLWHRKPAEATFVRSATVASTSMQFSLPNAKIKNRRMPTQLLLRLLTLLSITILFANNCHAFYQEFSSFHDYREYFDIASWLKDRHVKYGYAEYWCAYSVTFLAREEIILEPTDSVNIPYYADFVKSADRIAYVTSEPVPECENHIVLPGGDYRILDQTLFHKIHAYYLERE